MKFTKSDIEGIISMANRRIRQGGVVKENLTTENADGKTGKTDGNGLERTETDGVRFMAEPEDVIGVSKLDHSQYRENTMLSGDEDIVLINIPRMYKTVEVAEKEIAAKIKQANGRLIAKNKDQNMDILIQSNDSLDEAASEKAVNETLSDGTSAEIHAAALANIEQLLTEARLGVSHRDWHVYAKNQLRGTSKETALQVHRFYTAMQYGDDIYGVKMTVREKQNGSTVFYTLEAHDLDIEKINPETESSRGGVVKAALPGRSPAIKFSSFFEKFKPVDDLLGLKYKEKYPEVRFSIVPEDENLIVMHNVTAAKLRKAAKLGGLPAPSLAIADAEKSENKKHYEIVNYHYLGERQLRQKIKRATDQNGFVESIDRDGLPDPIITPKGAAGRFSALPTATIISQTSENANNLRFSVSGSGTDFNGLERNVTDNPNFKRWFADSKVVDDNGEPLVVYHQTAGEVEARNATTRADMSMDERRQTLLADTEDVAEEDKIYLEQLVSGVSEMSPLRRKPADLDDFLNMTGHTRPPRLNFDNTGEMFDAFKKHIIDANIVTPEGYRLVAKPGHFFVFCCGKKDNTHKGFIKRASSAKNALEMVKNSLIKPEEMSGFEMDRIRNIQTFVDVLTDPDFSYRHNNKIIYGKKYDDISNANGYTSVVLNISDNIISPIHSGIEKFNRQRLEKENITWYANLESDIPLDNARTTESVASREQLSDRLNNDSTKKQKVKSKNKNNKEFRFSVDVTDGNGLERTGTDGQDIRFLLSEYSEEERELIAAVLKPFVGFNLNRTDEEYQEYLRKKGVAVSTRDAHAFAVTAMRGNVADYNQRNAAKRKAAETRLLQKLMFCSSLLGYCLLPANDCFTPVYQLPAEANTQI